MKRTFLILLFIFSFAIITTSFVYAKADLNPNIDIGCDRATGGDPTVTPRTFNCLFIGFSIGNPKVFFPMLFAIALCYFLASVVTFVGAGDNEEKRAQGRARMIWGILVIFIMISVWGLVSLVTHTFFPNSDNESPFIPNRIPEFQK